jgi:hypothetical protein
MKKLVLAWLLCQAMPAFAQVFYDPYTGAMVPVHPSSGLGPCPPRCIDEGRDRSQERRRARFDALRAEGAPQAPAPGPVGVPRTGTSESRDVEIRPEYRTTGRVREEYESRGNMLPQFEEPAAAAKAAPAPAAAPVKRRARPMLPCPTGGREC